MQWIPSGSSVWSDYQAMISYFGELDYDGFIIAVSTDSSNIVTPSKLDTLYSIYTHNLYNTTCTYSSSIYNFQDLCDRPYPSYPYCYSYEASFFALFGNNPVYWQSQTNIQAVLDTYPDIASYFLGGSIFNETINKTIGGTHLRISFALEGSTTDTEDDINQCWMFSFEDYTKDIKTYYSDDGVNNFRFSYYTDASFGPELDRIVSADIPVLAGAFVVMLVYLTITLGQFDCVGGRPAVAVGSLVSTMSALIMGFGIGAACGIAFNTLIALIPFILLGVCVFMFVFVL